MRLAPLGRGRVLFLLQRLRAEDIATGRNRCQDARTYQPPRSILPPSRGLPQQALVLHLDSSDLPRIPAFNP